MRATPLVAFPLLATLVGGSVVSVSTGCFPGEHPEPDWLKAPASYDPVNTEGLTFNKAGIDALTLKEEGEERDAYLETLMSAPFAGQAICKSGSGTGSLENSKYGEFDMTCGVEGPILFDIELNYHLFTSKAVGKPLTANAYVEFGGKLVGFEYQTDGKPRKIEAKVEVGDDLRRLER